MKIIRLSLMVFLIFISSNLSASNYGKILGLIVDKNSGDPLVGVNVSLKGMPLGAATDIEGKYIILQVPPGVYVVQVEYVGYQSIFVKDVRVRANRIAYANIELSESILSTEAVEVIGERPVIEKDITATSRSISSEEIAALPTTTVTDVLRTQPGVVSENGLHFRGGRAGEVTYYMDGVPVVNPQFSNVSSSEVINRSAISEMQVISGTYSAEYGNSMSGVINITTRDGSNIFKAGLDVKTSNIGLEQQSNDNNRRVIRGDFSGPIFKDKTNFFVSGFYDDRDNYLPWGYNRDYNIFAKISDRHLNDIKLTGSVSYSKGKQKNYSHSWKYIPDQYWPEPNSDSQSLQFGLIHTLSKNLFYDFKIYYNRNHYDSGDFDENDLARKDPIRDSNNEFYLQRQISSYTTENQVTYGAKGNILWQANNYNEIKAGFELRQNEIERFYVSYPWTLFHTIEDYSRKPREGALYIQDKINFSTIILSAGLRLDLTDPNTDYWDTPYAAIEGGDSSKLSTDIYTQLSPRLGISYPVSENTVFHFGYGHYFQRPQYRFTYMTMTDDNVIANIVQNLETQDLLFANPFLDPEKTVSYEFGVSHQLFTDYLINCSVYSKKITSLTGRRTLYALDLYEKTFTLHVNEAFAYNNGIEVQFRKMRGKNFVGEVNYTYAVAEGSSSAPTERVGEVNGERQTLKFFPLNFDQRHSVNANLTFKLNQNEGPKIADAYIFENLRTTLLFRYGSGLPYTIGIRSVTEPYEINNGRKPATWNLDLKLERRIEFGEMSIVPYFEVYNLTNRKNVLTVYDLTGKPDFIEGRTYEWAANPENWGAPRLIYFGLRFNY